MVAMPRSPKNPPSKRAAASADGPPAEVSINVALPAELHKKLRIRAIIDDASLRETVIAALDAYLQTP